MLATVLAVHAEMFIPNPRSCWRYPRSSEWWESVVLSSFEHRDWMENFKMSRDTFMYLYNQLRPVIKKNIHMQQALATEQRVAITLWVLATPGEHRSVSHLFGVAQCAVCKVVSETCRATVENLLPQYIRFS